MSGSVFTPKINSVVENVRSEVEQPAAVGKDRTGDVLQKVAQYAVIVAFGFTPVFFMPGLWGSLGFDKALFSVSIGVIVVVAMSLLMLRRKRAQTVWPLPLSMFWGVALAALISGLLSGDIQDTIRGSVMETQTAGFLGILALAMSVPLVMQGSKIMSIKALAVFSVVSGLLLAYNILRLIFGAGFLPLGSFNVLTVSPIGSFNDLAIFAGLTIILGLITLAQLPLKTWIQYTVLAIVAMALFILAVVNFFDIWIIVGFFALLLFVYLLSRDTLFQNEADIKPASTPRSLVVSTLIVCVVSAVFIVAGDYAGSKIGEITGVNYVEVRPSLEATIDIAGGVYSQDFLLGVGPNRFADAWRQHKDKSINETIFWDTDFNAGSGYIPTLFVDLGALGSLLIIAFHLYFLFLGYKMLLRSVSQDFYWYYFGVVSFTAAVFLWSMSYIYVPGAGILLLAAMFTGFSFVAYGALLPQAVRAIPLATNKRRGFFLMAAIIFIISGSIGILFSVGEQYVTQSHFNESQATATDISQFEQIALDSYGAYPDDRFISALARINLSKLNVILNNPEPSEEVSQQFFSIAQLALGYASQAVIEDSTDPDNHAVLASIYSNIAITGVPEAEVAQERAILALDEAQKLDPFNPSYRLLSAQMAVRSNDVSRSREEIQAALTLKRNYTDALFLLAQLDINEGNAEAAIATVRAIISLEPNNPTRYFQLGVLLSSNDSAAEAIVAFREAVRLDVNYANARYFLALGLLNEGQTDAGLEQLKLVQQTNVDNAELAALIAQVESGEFVAAPASSLSTPVVDATPDKGPEDTVVTSEDTETNLVTPVNTISGTSEENQEQPVTPELVPEPEVVSGDVTPAAESE